MYDYNIGSAKIKMNSENILKLTDERTFCDFCHLPAEINSCLYKSTFINFIKTFL